MSDPKNLPDLTQPAVAPPKPENAPGSGSSRPDPEAERIAALADRFGAEDEQPAEGEAAAPSDVMPFDQWLVAFKSGHHIAGHMIGSKTLIEAPNAPQIDASARAIYDTCIEVEYFRWLIRPGGKWMQRASAVAAFAVPTAIGVMGDLRQKADAQRARKARDVTPKPKPAASEPKGRDAEDRGMYDG